MFQIKDFASIVASQIAHARSVTDKITDFQPGSVARTLIEAPAVEVEELYMQMLLGLRDAIPVATFLSFDFDRLPAAKAHGFVSVSKSPAPTAPIAIPLGTLFTNADGSKVYESTAAVTWGAGVALVRVPVVCLVAGSVGNVASGVITQSDAFGAGYTISNALIQTGRDEESDLEREARFAEFVQSLSRGTVFACRHAAGSARVLDADGNLYEYVTRVGINETPGIVRLYVYSSLGIPSAELIADGQLRMDGSRDDEAGVITPGFRPAGVRVDVLPMAERAVPLSVQVEMLDGFTFSAGVVQGLQDAYASVLAGASPGQTLYIGTLSEALLGVPGVRRIVPSTSENIVCAVNEALVPGALTATEL